MTDASPALFSGLSRRALLLPAWARGADLRHAGIRSGFDEARGPDLALTIAAGSYRVAGRAGYAIAVNGSIPGPLVRLREGEKARIVVHNLLHEGSSIHWHGLLPFQYDGVPGVSFPGIGPGESFAYEFPVRQAGTYWWHSHSGLQEQGGHYGPLIINPAGPDSIRADRDYVLLLSEFTRPPSAQHHGQAQKARGLFHPSAAELDGRLSDDRRQAPHVGAHADDADRYFRCRRRHLHLRQRPHPPARYQRLGHDLLQPAAPRPARAPPATAPASPAHERLRQATCASL